jgi:general secretion pathway protein H
MPTSETGSRPFAVRRPGGGRGRCEVSRNAERGFTSLKRSAEHGFTSLKRSAQHGFTSLKRSAEHGFTSLKRSAQHGFTSLKRSAEHGFTLIELMVVITIIGLMSAAVIFVFPDPRGPLMDEAERFAARALAVRDEAVIGSRETALFVDATGYGFERRRRGNWDQLREKPFGPARWSDGTSAAVPEGARGRVTFDPTGLASQALSVTITRDSAQVVVNIATDGTINVGS